MTAHPLCLAVAVNGSALERLLAEGDVGGYRDSHPWYVAAALLDAAREQADVFYLLLAAGTPLHLSHWAEVVDIEVHRYASNRETRVRIAATGPVSPLFEQLESITLPPSTWQLQREQQEGLRARRVHLDSHWIRPYAICETPAFLLARPSA